SRTQRATAAGGCSPPTPSRTASPIWGMNSHRIMAPDGEILASCTASEGPGHSSRGGAGGGVGGRVARLVALVEQALDLARDHVAVQPQLLAHALPSPSFQLTS